MKADWTLGGQMLAWFLNIATMCKEYLKSLEVEPDILGWVQDTQEGREALQASLQLLAEKYGKRKQSIFEFVANLTIPAQPRFIVADHFTKENKVVRFGGFGGTFNSWFMPMTEKEVGEAEAMVNKLQVQAKFLDMTLELGVPYLVSMSQIYWMISQQSLGEKPNGKNCLLLVNGDANLFRVIDVNGEERAVCIMWRGGRWHVFANDLELRDGWGAGLQIVSRK